MPPNNSAARLAWSALHRYLSQQGVGPYRNREGQDDYGDFKEFTSNARGVRFRVYLEGGQGHGVPVAIEHLDCDGRRYDYMQLAPR